MSAGDYYREWREERDRIAQEAADAEPATADADMWDRVERVERSLAALDRFLDGIEEALTGRPAVVVAPVVVAVRLDTTGPEGTARELARQSDAYMGPG